LPGPGSLTGRLRGLLILPVGGRRGFGRRCFCGRSSSSTRGASFWACSFARKKFWMRPIWGLSVSRVRGGRRGGVGRKEGVDVERALGHVLVLYFGQEEGLNGY